MTHGIDSQTFRIGSLTFVSVGQLFPHQFHNFHTQEYIYPIGYKVIRYYWSMTETNKRCPYTCSIGEVKNKPEFRVSTMVIEKGKEVEKTFVDSTPRGVWIQVLNIIEKLRRENKLVKVFPRHISGEDLFGFNEPNIIKGNFFSKVELSLVILTTFEFSRQKHDAKIRENRTFLSVLNPK